MLCAAPNMALAAQEALCLVLERERDLLQVPHFVVEHSSHFRLIGRGVPSVSVVSQLVYNFLWMASPRGNPWVPI